MPWVGARLLSAAILCAGLAAGCAGVPRATGFDDEPLEDTGTGLVWIVDGSGEHRTLWVSTEDGRPLASQPIEGPLWADGPRLWQWREESVGVPLYGCGPEAEEAPHGHAVARRVMVRDLVRSRDVELRAPPVMAQMRDVNHLVQPVASVGRFLFVNEQLELDACDVHRTAEAHALVWDLHAGGPAQLLSEREREALARVEVEVARERLRAERDGDDTAGFEQVQLVALWPRWEDGRHLALQYGFAADDDTEWGAPSTRVDAERLPAQLARHARVPVWVRAALVRTPDVTLAGFSRVEHAGPARILDTLRR